MLPIFFKDIADTIRINIENHVVNIADNTDISQIDENIFIGNISAATNKELLTSYGITHVMTALPVFYPPHPNTFNYHFVKSYDIEFYPLQSYFKESNEFIHNAIKNNGRVFIHCKAGISRSVTLAISYLLSTNRDATPEAMLEYIRMKRPIANPNYGFMKQLHSFYIDLHSSSIDDLD